MTVKLIDFVGNNYDFNNMDSVSQSSCLNVTLGGGSTIRPGNDL